MMYTIFKIFTPHTHCKNFTHFEEGIWLLPAVAVSVVSNLYSVSTNAKYLESVSEMKISVASLVLGNVSSFVLDNPMRTTSADKFRTIYEFSVVSLIICNFFPFQLDTMNLYFCWMTWSPSWTFLSVLLMCLPMPPLHMWDLNFLKKASWSCCKTSFVIFQIYKCL